MHRFQVLLVRFLRWTERYTRTDMVYLAGGSFWLVIEQAGGVLLSFGLATAFGHFAAPDMYGNYKYVLSLAALFGALSLARIGDAVGQSAARGNDGVLMQGFWLNLRWSWIFIAAALLGSAYYAFISENPFVAAALLVVALVQPVLTSSSLFSAFLYGKRAFAQGAIFSLSLNAVTTAAVVAALFFGERAIILVVTYFVARTIAAIYFTWRAARQARNANRDPGLLGFGAHLSVMNAIGAVADAFDSLIIFTLLGPSKLAIYAFAIAIPEQIKGVVKNLNNIVFPKFAGRPISEIKRTIVRKLVILSAAIVFTLVVYVLAAPSIFALLFPLYTAAVPYTQLYAVSIAFTGVSQILYSALYAHKRTRELYIISNMPPMILIGSLVLLVPLYGVWGAICSQIIFRALNLVLTIVLFYRVRD